jgi:hypothetical protein
MVSKMLVAGSNRRVFGVDSHAGKHPLFRDLWHVGFQEIYIDVIILLYICIFIYVYIYLHIYIYINAYIYIHTGVAVTGLSADGRQLVNRYLTIFRNSFRRIIDENDFMNRKYKMNKIYVNVMNI